MVVLTAVTTLGFIMFTCIIDATHIRMGDRIDHFPRAMQRMFFFLAIFFFDWKLGLASLLLFTAVFDHFLNYLIYKPFFYLGTTAKWDIFWSKHKLAYIIMKAIVVLASIFLFNYA